VEQVVGPLLRCWSASERFGYASRHEPRDRKPVCPVLLVVAGLADRPGVCAACTLRNREVVALKLANEVNAAQVAIEEATRKEPLKEPLRDMSSTPPPAVEAPAPKPEPTAALGAGEMAVWAAYRLHHPTAKATPPKAHQGLLRAAVAEHGAEAVVSVIRWAHQSDHKQAAFLRDGGYTGLDNLLRKEKLPGRIELAGKEAAGDVHAPKLSALPPGMKPRGVVINSESGRVEVEEGPRQPAAQGGKRDNLSLATMFYSEIVNAETEEESENEA